MSTLWGYADIVSVIQAYSSYRNIIQLRERERRNILWAQKRAGHSWSPSIPHNKVLKENMKCYKHYVISTYSYWLNILYLEGNRPSDSGDFSKQMLFLVLHTPRWDWLPLDATHAAPRSARWVTAQIYEQFSGLKHATYTGLAFIGIPEINTFS